jgi:hypothetical protein
MVLALPASAQATVVLQPGLPSLQWPAPWGAGHG